jgi:hypothetical protein
MGKPFPLVTINELCMFCKYMALSTGIFVEIGTRYGGTSRLIAETFPDSVVITVDITKQYEPETFAGLPNVVAIEGDSQAGPVGLGLPLSLIGVLFEDAQHTPEAVQNDLILWSPYVEEGGYVIVHDAIRQYEPTLTSVGGLLLVHTNQDGVLESGYHEIGMAAKSTLSEGWTLVDQVDSCLVFQRDRGL